MLEGKPAESGKGPPYRLEKEEVLKSVVKEMGSVPPNRPNTAGGVVRESHGEWTSREWPGLVNPLPTGGDTVLG